MDSTARERLLEAALPMFAESGFRGAPVRAICTRARLNPGAVSYHFGGKRQLYRATLRHAVQELAREVRAAVSKNEASAHDLEAVVRGLDSELHARPELVRLLLRDLADGGSAMVEALAPVARAAIEAVGDDQGRPVAAAYLLRAFGPVLALHILAPLLGSATGEEIERVRRALVGSEP